MSSRERGHFFMAYIRGEAREQTTMFPATLDELIPVDHMCRVMEAFVGRLNMAKLGFVRAEPAETGRPGYDPRDLLKLYLGIQLVIIAFCCRWPRRPSRRWDIRNRWQRLVSRHLHEDAFQRMQQRATPEMMRLRRSTVEHPFASLKYHIFGHPRFLLRGLKGAQTEISLATMVYNLKRMLNVSGGSLRAALVS